MASKSNNTSSSSSNGKKRITELQPNDVLMGRGKRVSESPGNRRFREVVAQHRPAYILAERLAKSQVARDVIAQVRESGGRFLKESDDSKHYHESFEEVHPDRVVEKVCQALREKPSDEKSSNLRRRHESTVRKKQQQQSPSERPAKPTSRRKAANTPRRHLAPSRKPAGSSSDDNDETTEDDDDSDRAPVRRTSRPAAAAPSSSSSPSSEEESSDDDDDNASNDDPYELLNKRQRKLGPIAQIRNWNMDDMLERLRHFRSQHGHTAVPSVYSADVALSDWCSAQRQVYREVQQSMKIATEAEESLLEELQGMDFCFDFEDWHWHQQFQHVQIGLTRSLQRWLNEQRRLYHAGLLPHHRARQLHDAGIPL